MASPLLALAACTATAAVGWVSFAGDFSDAQKVTLYATPYRASGTWYAH